MITEKIKNSKKALRNCDNTNQMTQTAHPDPASSEEKSHESKDAQKAQRGYSLLEILVVLAIIGVLATLVGPRLFNQVDRSKLTTAKAQARSLKTSIDAMYFDIGRYPTNEEGLSLLVVPPSDPALSTNWFGPYIDGDLPKDPWGNDYRYKAPAKDQGGFDLRPQIFTYGADNEEGGSGLNQDISA